MPVPTVTTTGASAGTSVPPIHPAPRRLRPAPAAATRVDGMSSKDKALILGLHGYLQNAELFRSRIGSVRKALKSRVGDWCFLDAPFEATVEALGGAAKTGGDATEEDSPDLAREAGGTATGGRSWWTWEAGVERPSKARVYDGMGDSMLLVARELNARRPDGIFAFSQGASAAAILLAATRPSTSGSAETEAMVTGLGLGEVHVQRFAVLVGPFLANDPRWAQVVQERRPTGTKVLIVTGEDDALVPVAKSESLAAAFDPEFVQVLRHPGGHMVPTGTGEFKRQLNEFIDSVMGVTVAA